MFFPSIVIPQASLGVLPLSASCGRIKLWSVELGRTALRVMPQSLVLECVKWGFQYFWGRRAGWPDLFAFDSRSFLFIEVKSPTDKLSLEQMNWFRWVIKEANMPCELGFC